MSVGNDGGGGVCVVCSVNESTGEIRVNSALSHRMASVVVLTVRAVDANAADNVAGQYDEAEVTLFVRPHANRNPVFADAAGLPDGSSAPIVVGVDEEMPVGSVLLRLAAVDALTNRSLHGFRAVAAVPRQIAVGRAGDVVLAERLDYETLPADKVSTVGRRARAGPNTPDGQNGWVPRRFGDASAPPRPDRY